MISSSSSSSSSWEIGKGGMRKGEIGKSSLFVFVCCVFLFTCPIPPFLIPPFPFSRSSNDAEPPQVPALGAAAPELLVLRLLRAILFITTTTTTTTTITASHSHYLFFAKALSRPRNCSMARPLLSCPDSGQQGSNPNFGILITITTYH